MNFFRNFFYLQSVFSLFVTMALAGCLSGHPGLTDNKDAGQTAEYVSEVTLPAAKSAFAYARYRLLVSDGKWKEAQTALEQAVAIDSESRYLQMSLAKVYLHTKQQEHAIQVLEKLLTQYPDDADGHELIGDLLLHQNQPQEAAVHYRQTLELREQTVPLRLKLAMALARQGDLSSAIEETLSIQHPESLSARLTLARFYKEDEQFNEAVTIYRELLVAKAGRVQVVLELGELFQDLGRTDDALQLYQSGIDENPGAVTLHEQMARLLVTEQRYAEALKLLQQLDDLHPDRIEIMGRIGLLQLEMARWAEAELTFRKLLRLNPDHDRSRYYLGMALSGGGDYQAGLKELASVRQGSEVYLEAVTQRAFLYQRLDQPQAAIDLLQKMIDDGQNDPIIFYYLSSSFAA